MLNPAEKEYFRALEALRRKEYRLAAEHFDKAVPQFKKDGEFVLLRETNRLLVSVTKELSLLESDNELQIEEIFTDG